MKENVSRGQTQYDDDDKSVIRSEAHFNDVIFQSNLQIVHKETQQGFPPELYPVFTYILQQK